MIEYWRSEKEMAGEFYWGVGISHEGLEGMRKGRKAKVPSLSRFPIN